MSGRVFLFFPPRGRVTASTQTSAFNVLACQSPVIPINARMSLCTQSVHSFSVNGKSSVYSTTTVTTAVGQRRQDGTRCITFCVLLLWMLQNTPHEVYTSISAVRLRSYCTYARTFALYGADAPKQDACYCEFYWAVNFVVHDTMTIPSLSVVRSTVAN